jgi:hypothetical protein
LCCDVIFVDTSSTYWEVDVADEEIDLATARAQSEEKEQEASGDDGPSVPSEMALRQFSKHSKDHRSDLPQVVIAMAVTTEGIPVRCWSFPGRLTGPSRRMPRGWESRLRAFEMFSFPCAAAP